MLSPSRPAARLWIALTVAVVPLPAHAGPPYVTDDPEPTDTGHWEIYNYAGGTFEPDGRTLQFGVDANYGPTKDIQLTATVPLQIQTGQPFGAGDIELAVKAKFLHQTGGPLPLDVSVFPRVILPTAHGSARTQVLLPVWAERDWGAWSLFGGGGYTLNPGAGNRNY